MPVRGPAWSWRIGARANRSELVEADHRGALWRVGVEFDDPGSFGTNAGSSLSDHGLLLRQRTPSRKRMRLIWERLTTIPRLRAAAVRASSVQCASLSSSKASSSPPPPRTRRPGGSVLGRAMILERSSSVRRGLRPAPGRSESPSIPSELKRWRRVRTVLGWQPSTSATLVVRSPCQLEGTIRTRDIQSPGAWRLPASLRIFPSSSASSGARAYSSFGMISSPFPIRRLGHVLMYTAFDTAGEFTGAVSYWSAQP
jgi:hypothetical protein